MPQNYFVTGLPKSGKTTILWKLVKELKKEGLKVGGFLSPDEKHHGSRTAFHVIDVESGNEGILADVHGDGPKVSKYHVNLKGFERIAVPCMKNCKKYDVFFIDEIGSMEMKSTKFGRTLDDVLDANVPLIASINDRYLPKFRHLGEVVEVNLGNREIVHGKLLEAAKTLKKKPARRKKISKKKMRKSVKKKPSKPRRKKAAKKPRKEKKMPEEKKMEKKPGPKMTEKEERPRKKKGIVGKIKGMFGL